MGRIVIVAYVPKPGMTEPLLAAVRKHLSVLYRLALIHNNHIVSTQ